MPDLYPKPRIGVGVRSGEGFRLVSQRGGFYQTGLRHAYRHRKEQTQPRTRVVLALLVLMHVLDKGRGESSSLIGKYGLHPN